MVNFVKHMKKTDVTMFPKWKPDTNPNWQEYIMAKGIPQNPVIYDIENEAKRSDIMVCQRVHTDEGLCTILAIRDKWKKKLLLEIDDNALGVDSSNPGYSSVHPGSIAEKCFLTQLKESNGVITTTEYLRTLYKEHNPKVWIVPNGMDFNVWDKLKAPKKDKKIRIGWEGALHHMQDLTILSDVVPKILNKYKNVEFHFFGFMPDFLKTDRCFVHDVVDISQYPKTLRKLNFDISLAPLLDSEFNRGKSNIRVLESGAMAVPVVASAGTKLPYERVIGNSLGGFVARNTQEWVDRLSSLIESEGLRCQMGGSLYDYVKKNYNTKFIAKDYEQILLTA
jgi:glycosyltransferase involved in cell wall biosynthesis